MTNPLDFKFYATPLLCLKLICSLKMVDFRPKKLNFKPNVCLKLVSN